MAQERTLNLIYLFQIETTLLHRRELRFSDFTSLAGAIEPALNTFEVLFDVFLGHPAKRK